MCFKKGKGAADYDKDSRKGKGGKLEGKQKRKELFWGYIKPDASLDCIGLDANLAAIERQTSWRSAGRSASGWLRSVNVIVGVFVRCYIIDHFSRGSTTCPRRGQKHGTGCGYGARLDCWTKMRFGTQKASKMLVRR